MIVRLDREAFEIGSISLKLSGKAKVAALNWHRKNEENWLAGRRLEFPVDPNGTAQSYEIDVSREPQWAGKIVALRISAQGGSVELSGITLHPLRTATRSISLHGVTVPSLIGQERIEVPFDGDLPRPARFEASIGLLPEFEAMDATGCFTLSLEAGGKETSLFHRCLEPAETRRAGCQISQDVDLFGAATVPSRGQGRRSRVDNRRRALGRPVLLGRRADAAPNPYWSSSTRCADALASALQP